ncbi:cupin domain-containing protein [Agrobacterium sp. P15N1-A]|uniref:cupin domain-containing protein n=1 Tax=Agrobacterium sp. P15N1-A TaxID=3342820 RepID=UPI0037D856F2
MSNHAEAKVSTTTGISAIKRIGPDDASRFVPPLSDYTTASAGWSEAEYRCLEIPSANVIVGYWEGEVGSISFEQWPYTEVCSILTGKVGLRDRVGAVVEFGAGEGFVVPKDWSGEWLTLEKSTKFFIAIQ